MTTATLEKCPIVSAVEEYRAAGKAVDGEGDAWSAGRANGLDGDALYAYIEGQGFTGYEEDRWSAAIVSLHKLAFVSQVSRAGAIAALELATDPTQDALRHDDCQALAALALRYLRATA